MDLVLHAHEHIYQRTRQLATGSTCTIVNVDSFDGGRVVDDGEDDIYTKGSGSDFVVMGTAGAKPDDINPDNLEAGYFAKWMVANSDPRTGFTKFTVSNTDILG